MQCPSSYHLCEEPSHVRLTQHHRVHITIPELVKHCTEGETRSTIEEERVYIVCVSDVLAEGLKHISQLQSITQEVDKEVLPHCCCDVKPLEVCWCVEWHELYMPVEFLIESSHSYMETHSY